MRVTQTMLSNNMLQNLNKNMERMSQTQYKLSTGKEVRFPSDDPVRAVRGIKHRSGLTEIHQYQDNIKDAKAWNEYTDSVLMDITSALQRFRELVVYSGDEALEQTSLESIAKELNQLIDHIGAAANAQMGGRYIFAGTDTLNPPYDPATRTWVNTNTDKIQVEVGRGTKLDMNLNGVDIFGPSAGPTPMFDLLTDIANQVQSGQSAADHLEELDGLINNMLSLQARVGANYNRLEMIESRLGKMEIQTTKLMSRAEDADLAEVIMDLKNQENVHRASLAAGARIIQPSLMDFLR